MITFPLEVRSERLLLRPWEESDAPALGRAITDSLDHLLPWMPWAASEPASLDDRVALIRQWSADAEEGRDAIYGVFLDGVPIGGSGLHGRRGRDTLEIGYWIHAAHVRRGYATELAQALTSAAFAIPCVEHVEIHHDRNNTASGGIPHALGFRLVFEARRTPQAPGECGIVCGWRISNA